MPLGVKWYHFIAGFLVSSELMGVGEQGRNTIIVILYVCISSLLFKIHRETLGKTLAKLRCHRKSSCALLVPKSLQVHTISYVSVQRESLNAHLHNALSLM